MGFNQLVTKPSRSAQPQQPRLVQRRGASASDKRIQSQSRSLPPRLRRGMEKLTGVNLANVRVHYNSPKPALVQAHAYAQGKDIYLSPGQEKHLPHELGHIAQQALGMVKPTTEVNGVAVNDDPKLEQQATDWGEKAVRLGGTVRKA
ncbi:DUF4157 domain-containing protein [Pseudoalteromonas luteoviolacea]|uniref:eCIS core domain-containing protein n=1 Tax=Pseudoalteromonas luteoviolacea TaxID=43657 RepID=UPI001F2FF993|nr:DUF4157 domain-containing protein [Pseudoalteromonas luteoviolacea]MCF6438451.1 DUF4157 domain-containing protein [Pseudoalteromonas luteoviolacea]